MKTIALLIILLTVNFGFDIHVETKVKNLECKIQSLELRIKELESTKINYIQYAIDYSESLAPLVLAIIKVESNFNPRAVSSKNALGLMQILPTTAMDEYNLLGYTTSLSNLSVDLIKDPRLNITLGTNYIKTLFNILYNVKDNRRKRLLVLASYNAGIHTVKEAFNCNGFVCYNRRANNYTDKKFTAVLKKLPLETRNYLVRVEANYSLYRSIL